MGCCDFENSLHYVSPAHGGWGVVRIAAMVPESQLLFVAPSACGRHGALGGALNGIKERISYLFIDESDIVSGGYEDLIPDAIEELLDILEKRPKVLIFFYSCLDDLLGTDHVALNERLSKQFPDVTFLTCHMNPFKLDTKFPPGITLQDYIYSLLDESEVKDNSINSLGNNVKIDENCEIYKILGDNGYSIRHISENETFAEFKTMGRSKLNIVLSPVAKYAATELKKNKGMDYLLSFTTYDIDEIKQFYQSLADKLGIEINTDEYEKRAVEKIKAAHDVIGDYPIAIDYQAARKPFTLARLLLKFGFNVKLIMTDSLKSTENEAIDFIRTEHPEITIINAVQPEMVRFESESNEYLCIGFDCGYATKSESVVDMLEDDNNFGFYGIETLMERMIYAFNNYTSVRNMIKEAGLII